MPAWWSRKSSSSSSSANKPNKSYDTLPLTKKTIPNFQIFDSPKSTTKTNKSSPKSPNKSNKSSPKSPNRRTTFNTTELKPRTSSSDSLSPTITLRSLQSTPNSTGFSGFDSDCCGVKRKTECHPLPTPLSSSNNLIDHGVGVGLLINGGSVSVSSVSSSGSSDDVPPPLHEQFAQLGVSSSRGLDDMKLRVRARSPGPGTKPLTTSPLHPRMGSSSSTLESPTEDQGHPLPLPPSSPTSPSAATTTTMHNCTARASSFTPETIVYCDPSKWMKGKLLGRGTFGHVYLGFNSEKGQMCAIKEVRLISDDRNSKECLKQLNQEISLLNQLSHPNIVRYYGSELGDEALSVYLEYVSGGSIHKLLQEYGAFKEPVVQNYTRQILSGLAYLHARKTVHRDIKGANILVDPHGEIKLADFGMAKHITNCTSMLSFKGSPYWMAPEVVMNTNGYNLAVDIWSLGCTVLEMATSKPPWSQFEGVAAIFKIGNSKEIPEIPDYLSHDAKDFLRRCFQRDPAARPSATELLCHPFVRDQTMMRAPGSPSLSAATDAFPFAFDGPHKPKALDINPRRKSISTYEADEGRRLVVPGSRELWDNSRTIISLPVSPCSSPLRQSGHAYKSCYMSPPNPAYAWMGQTSQTSSDFSLSPTRAGRPQNFLLDPLNDVHLYRGQTSGASSRILM